jgi:hypothetical protein
MVARVTLSPPGGRAHRPGYSIFGKKSVRRVESFPPVTFHSMSVGTSSSDIERNEVSMKKVSSA